MSRITLSKVHCNSEHPVHISHTLQNKHDLTWNVYISGHLVTRDRCSLLSDVPHQVTCPTDYHRLFSIVLTSNVCCGNPDNKFEPLKKQCRGTFKNAAGDRVVAFVDTKVPVCDGNEMHAETIRHSFCELLTVKGKCIKCASFRNSPQSMLSHSSKQARDKVGLGQSCKLSLFEHPR